MTSRRFEVLTNHRGAVSISQIGSGVAIILSKNDARDLAGALNDQATVAESEDIHAILPRRQTEA